MFCLVVPPKPPIFTDQFQQVDALKWNCDVETGEQIREVALFITQPLADPNFGLSCYISAPPFDKWKFIGGVHNGSPSGIFRISWDPTDPIASAVRVGIVVEPLPSILAQQATQPPGHEFVHFGTGVAQNLVNFLQSFPELQGPPGQHIMSLFDRWLIRFKEKCQKDPFFWLKS